MNEQLAAALSAALDRRSGPGHRVENLTRLSGGASRETWRVVVADAAGDRRTVILKRDPPEAAGPAGPEGLWIAAGDGGTGFVRAPAIARLIAQMMAGERPDFDPTIYAPERFAAPEETAA